MALPMARPVRHPTTGIFWLRKRVPDDLLAVIGKREVTKTLGTRDPAEAKERHATALALIEAEWSALRKGLGPRLTELVVQQLEESMSHRWLAHHTGARKQNFWRTELYDGLWEAEANPFSVVPPPPIRIAADDAHVAAMSPH